MTAVLVAAAEAEAEQQQEGRVCKNEQARYTPSLFPMD